VLIGCCVPIKGRFTNYLDKDRTRNIEGFRFLQIFARRLIKFVTHDSSFNILYARLKSCWVSW
jgi:hypothetical protein